MSRNLRLDISEVAQAMESSSPMDEHQYYLDTETGKVLVLSEVVLRAVSDNDKEVQEELPAWQSEEVEIAKAISSDEIDRYQEIPDIPPSDGYKHMEEFASAVTNTTLQKKLTIALDGAGAFRRFKNVLEGYPDVREKWFSFKEQKVREEVLIWLDSIDINPVGIEHS